MRQHAPSHLNPQSYPVSQSQGPLATSGGVSLARFSNKKKGLTDAKSITYHSLAGWQAPPSR
jgi:hypothetical protein